MLATQATCWNADCTYVETLLFLWENSRPIAVSSAMQRGEKHLKSIFLMDKGLGSVETVVMRRWVSGDECSVLSTELRR